jgi:hypothetical protein
MGTFAPRPNSAQFKRVFLTSAIQIFLAVYGFSLTAQIFAFDHSHGLIKVVAATLDSALLGCLLALILTPVRLKLLANDGVPGPTGLSLKSALVALAIGVAVALIFAFDHLGGRFH